MNSAQRYAIDTIAGGARLGHAGDILRLSAALKLFPADSAAGIYCRQVIRAGMRERMQWHTRVQREWQAKIGRTPAHSLHNSNAPARYNRPDASRWYTRERYVTCR